MTSIPRKKRITCRRYLRWIKTKPCLVFNGSFEAFAVSPCAGMKDPHHVVPVSLGGSDFKAVPLCRKHHDEAQKSRSAFEAKYAIAFDYEIEQLNKAFLRECPPKQPNKSTLPLTRKEVRRQELEAKVKKLRQQLRKAENMLELTEET